jgi:hypothetical protein
LAVPLLWLEYGVLHLHGFIERKAFGLGVLVIAIGVALLVERVLARRGRDTSGE